MTTTLRLLLLAAPALLAGCANAPPDTAGGTVAATAMRTHTEMAAARAMLLDRCPLSDRESGGLQPALAPAAIAAPVLAALVPIATQFAVSAVTDYLARLESERDAVWNAIGIGAIPASGTRCLVVARGRFGAAPADRLPTQGSLDHPAMRLVGLAAPPDFYMEARLEIVPGAPARAGQAVGGEIVLRPQVVHVARSAALRDAADPKSIGMVVALRATAVGRRPTEQSVTDGAAAVFALNLGRLAAGTEVRPASFAAAGGTDAEAHPLAHLAQRASLPSLPARLNIDAFVTEAADPNRVLRLLNAAVKDNAKGVQDALTAAIQKALADALAERPRR